MTTFAGGLLTTRASKSGHARCAHARKAASRILDVAVDCTRASNALGEEVWLEVAERTTFGTAAWRTDGLTGVLAGQLLGGGAAGSTASSGLLTSLLQGETQALQASRGQFCAAVLSSDRRCLLATDKLASRPVYFCMSDGVLTFASSLALLRDIQPTAPDVDEQGLAEALILGQPLQRRTGLAGLQVLQPGERFRLDSDGTVHFDAYFDLRNTGARQIDDEAEMTEAIDGVFREAVALRVDRSRMQQAFLSGGMDSRVVAAHVAALGLPLQTFCTSYRGSTDDVISAQVAEALGAQHRRAHRTPAERVKLALDAFAFYARETFPRADAGPRAIWSGDGGSVGMGHTYLEEEAVALAGNGVGRGELQKLFPQLHHRRTRHVPRAVGDRWREAATAGLEAFFGGLQNTRPDRRMFLYYLLNDQTRHLYQHYEWLDRSGIELLTPFFDADLLGLIASLPIRPFLRHRLYNHWMRSMPKGVGRIHWQSYLGHEPSPTPPPSNVSNQWDASLYRSADVRRSYRQMASAALRRRPTPWVDRRLLRLAWLSSLAGSHALDHEITTAMAIHALLGDAASTA